MHYRQLQKGILKANQSYAKSWRVNTRPGVYTGQLKAAILDWRGTTADAHVIAPAKVFKDL